jgi:hypothetical protein
MTAPDRVGAKRSRIGCRRHHKHASLFNRLKRCSSPRHGAVGGWHFCEMPKAMLFRGSLRTMKDWRKYTLWRRLSDLPLVRAVV